MAFLREKARLVMALAVGLTLVGCAGTPPVKHGPAPGVAQQQDGGFTLAEDARVAADVRADFESAVKLLEAKQYDQGIGLLLKATQKAPNLVAAHVDLGIAYERSGDLEKAQASLERALALDPRHVVAYNELGMVLRREGRFTDARAEYEKALALAPDFHYARLNLAILCDLYLADSKCALENYLAYQRLVPDDRQAAAWINELRSRAGQ
jgi:tetratricopeptide (TPR) repeat protein